MSSKNVPDSACRICTSTPRLSFQYWMIASVVGPTVAPAPLSASVISGSSFPYFDSASSSFARSGSYAYVFSASVYPGTPGMRMPFATGMALFRITSAIFSRSTAIANACRTFGSSNGGTCTLKPM
jgi:hypothetical protein